MTGWVPYWDDSFSPVPTSRLHEMYAAGYRVWARYVAGGSAGKWFTRAEVDAWFALGPDAGIFVLFEAQPDEPTAHPELGAPHARAARAAARALGVPDDVSICPAMDTNVNAAQWQGAIATYCRNWKAADTTAPLLYVEADAGGWLHAQGLTAGTFTPAAYGWNSPPVLYTPTNAPSHVVATQEHNGRLMAGGVVDIGHIRTTAPIWWRTPDTHQDQGVDMALTDADAAVIWAHLLHNDVTGADVPAGTFLRSINTQVNSLAGAGGSIGVLDTEVDAITASEAAQATVLGQIQAALAGVPAAVVAALPAISGGQPGFTDAQLAQIGQAVAEVLGRTTANLTVAPPAVV